MMVSSVPDPLALIEPKVDCWDFLVFLIPGEQKWSMAVCTLEWCSGRTQPMPRTDTRRSEEAAYFLDLPLHLPVCLGMVS